MRRRAVTLIEVLVVMGIISMLAGMLQPVVVLAQRRAQRTNTESLLRKVETGLELFRGEQDTYPFQDHPATEPFPAAPNRLAWTLGHDLTAAERTALETDLAVARGAYAPGGAHVHDSADLDPSYSTSGNAYDRQRYKEMAAGVINRMAAERASLAVLAGNLAVTGIRGKTGTAVVPDPVSTGFARNYLAAELTPTQIGGDAILDAYGRELVYVCPVVQGMRSIFVPECLNNDIWRSPPSKAVEVDYYGLDTRGRELATSLASDIRTTAAQPHLEGFELWSAGPDGRIHPQRDHPDNRDNIAARDYQRSLR